MTFQVAVDIMPRQELLDPQGKTVEKNLPNLGISNVQNVRIGKHITFQLTANTEDEAHEIVKTTCEKILTNKIMESYTYELTTAS